MTKLNQLKDVVPTYHNYYKYKNIFSTFISIILPTSIISIILPTIKYNKDIIPWVILYIIITK